MRLKKFVKSWWKDLYDFEKSFLITFLIFVILFTLISILFPNSLNSQLEWISKVFSVPIITETDKAFGIDASGIQFIFTIFIAAILSLVINLINLKFKKKK